MGKRRLQCIKTIQLPENVITMIGISRLGRSCCPGLYITIFTILSFVGVRFLFLYLKRPTSRRSKAVSAYVEPAHLPPAPQLQVDEPRTWAHQLAIEKEQTEDLCLGGPEGRPCAHSGGAGHGVVAERGLACPKPGGETLRLLMKAWIMASSWCGWPGLGGHRPAPAPCPVKSRSPDPIRPDALNRARI